MPTEEKFVFNCAGEIQKIEFALARAGYTHADVERLASGDTLGKVREFLRGNAQIKESDFFRETGELTLQIPALQKPTLKELQRNFSWIKSIEPDNSPTEAVTLKLATVLRQGESGISGDEYERRIAPKRDIILGYQQAVWLVEHQDEFPEFMALLGKVYIDFSGLVVVHEDGNRVVPYLGQDDERWYLAWSWLDYGFRSGGRIAVAGKQQIETLAA